MSRQGVRFEAILPWLTNMRNNILSDGEDEEKRFFCSLSQN
jgi:hypothetical protein